MSFEHFDVILQELMHRVPFRAFTIELYGGELFEIDHPRALFFQDGVAVFLAPGSLRVIIDHDSVLKIIDASRSLIS